MLIYLYEIVQILLSSVFNVLSSHLEFNPESFQHTKDVMFKMRKKIGLELTIQTFDASITGILIRRELLRTLYKTIYSVAGRK